MDPIDQNGEEEKRGLERQIEELRAEISNLRKQAYGMVKENPGMALAGAALLAGLLGFLAGYHAAEGHRRNRHHHWW